MNLFAYNLEFRGVIPKKTKSGNTVFNIALEDENANQIQLYVGADTEKFKGLKKGDVVDLLLGYNLQYKNMVVFEVIPHGKSN